MLQAVVECCVLFGRPPCPTSCGWLGAGSLFELRMGLLSNWLHTDINPYLLRPPAGTKAVLRLTDKEQEFVF